MASHRKQGMASRMLRTLAVTGIAAAATKFFKKRQADQRAAERQAYSRAANAATSH
ncbi:hypothetical protein ACFVMC_14550 [Nocardia sp. NPDC127579]|uniref:hypothetical protein n=1 Tax=Nocardia sp. NPDC127579 TaxID=3345402 RepID=UPI00362BADBF